MSIRKIRSRLRGSYDYLISARLYPQFRFSGIIFSGFVGRPRIVACKIGDAGRLRLQDPQKARAQINEWAMGVQRLAGDRRWSRPVTVILQTWLHWMVTSAKPQFITLQGFQIHYFRRRTKGWGDPAAVVTINVVIFQAMPSDWQVPFALS